MANTYRETQRLDLAAEREASVLRGATLALVVVAAFSVADLLITGGEYLLVNAKRVAAAASVRIALSGVVYAAFTLGGVLAIHRAARIARPSWIALVILAATGVAATAGSIELGRMAVQMLPESELIEWMKGLEVVVRASALCRPISLAVLLLYAGAKWRRSGERPTVQACPSCGTPLDTR